MTALAIDDKGLQLATVSEDAYLHVWSLEPASDSSTGDGETKQAEAKTDATDDLSLALVYTSHVTDALLTGVQFVVAAPGAGKNTDLAVTAYDVDAVSIWSRD